MLSFVIMIVRMRWLAKDEIDIIDLLNASDAFRKPLENPLLNLSKPVIVVIFTIF
ncbi:hypothetical protein LAYK3_15640 [Lactobacillus amylovorus subsp. amylovorus]|nr:hypothetical protein LAYK3_15640 [Lactobacillus amylovorus]GMM22176.1 hypothetical protein LAYK10_14880 [Lactobacillus amylovorus]